MNFPRPVNRTSYRPAETLSARMGEELIEHFLKLNFNYYHDLRNGVYIRTPCNVATGTVFDLQKNNTLVYYRPVYKSDIVIDIGYCKRCGTDVRCKMNSNEQVKLGYCPYYENAANVLIRWVKNVQRKNKKCDITMEDLDDQWEAEYDEYVTKWSEEYDRIEAESKDAEDFKYKAYALREIMNKKKTILNFEHEIRVLRLKAGLLK